MSFAIRGARLLTTRGLRAMQSRGYAEEMSFTLAAANKVFYDNANVRQVDVPSFSGSFGILPKHVPTLAVLKPGVVTIYEADGSAKKVFVSSGTITVNEDSSVQVLAEEAHPVEDLDASAAREVLAASQSELGSASTDKVRTFFIKFLNFFTNF
jgi:F-type H+-transporting ATPase subunit delta